MLHRKTIIIVIILVISESQCEKEIIGIAVMRCCPSIRTFLPMDFVPSFSLTSGFCHTMIYLTRFAENAKQAKFYAENCTNFEHEIQRIS